MSFPFSLSLLPPSASSTQSVLFSDRHFSVKLAGDVQMDMSHVLVIAPLVIFALFFLVVLILRSFFLMRWVRMRSITRLETWCFSKDDQRRERMRRGLPPTSGNSETVLEISCNNHFNINSRNNVSANNNNPSPPSYYAEVMATDSSALYPVYVPPYAAPLMSLRDPRQFQGLPGLAAPPPYPPPPSYNQVSSFPGLPTGNSQITFQQGISFFQLRTQSWMLLSSRESQRSD